MNKVAGRPAVLTGLRELDIKFKCFHDKKITVLSSLSFIESMDQPKNYKANSSYIWKTCISDLSVYAMWHFVWFTDLTPAFSHCGIMKHLYCFRFTVFTSLFTTPKFLLKQNDLFCPKYHQIYEFYIWLHFLYY